MTLTTLDLDLLAQAYGWDGVLRTSALHEGENKTYVATTLLGSYVVRVYRVDRYIYTEVAAELEWLEALRDKVPVEPALRNINGDPYTVLTGHPTKICAVFKYVDGTEIYPPSTF